MSQVQFEEMKAELTSVKQQLTNREFMYDNLCEWNFFQMDELQAEKQLNAQLKVQLEKIVTNDKNFNNFFMSTIKLNKMLLDEQNVKIIEQDVKLF